MQLQAKWAYLFKTTPYPTRYETKNLGKTTAILFSVLFVFLLLYKPFGVYEPELKFNYILICVLHALSPSLIVYTYFRLLNYVSKRRGHPQQWSLFKEYCRLALLLFLIGIASFLMRDLIYTNPDNRSLRYFWEEIRNCYLAGCLFYVALVRFYREPRSVSKQKAPVQSSADLFITTQVKQDNFSLNPNNLLFAKAEGNYVMLTRMTNDKITTELKRISLRQLESQLSEYTFILRCHRAYLVNVLQVELVSGNSQGYTLTFKQHHSEVPVSRAQLNKFDELYERCSEFRSQVSQPSQI